LVKGVNFGIQIDVIRCPIVAIYTVAATHNVLMATLDLAATVPSKKMSYKVTTECKGTKNFKHH